MCHERKYCMNTFYEWLTLHTHQASLISQLRLLENFYILPSAEYDKMFHFEVEQIDQRIDDPLIKDELKELKDFQFTRYIASAVRNSLGTNDEREVQGTTHDLVSRLLLGKVFSGYDPTRHGPLIKRFKRSIGNALRNLAEKRRNRRRLLPTVSIGTEFHPGGIMSGDIAARSQSGDDSTIEEFRGRVREELGDLALAVFDLRLAGEETKSLVGSEQYARPTSYQIKKLVRQIKKLVKSTFQDDPEMSRQIDRSMTREKETVRKRREALAG